MRRGLPARLDEGDQWEELEREGRGVSPRVSQQRGQRWLQMEESPAWVSAKARGAREWPRGAQAHGAHARGLGLGAVHVTCGDFDAALLEVAPALGHRGASGGLG